MNYNTGWMHKDILPNCSQVSKTWTPLLIAHRSPKPKPLFFVHRCPKSALWTIPQHCVHGTRGDILMHNAHNWNPFMMFPAQAIEKHGGQAAGNSNHNILSLVGAKVQHCMSSLEITITLMKSWMCSLWTNIILCAVNDCICLERKGEENIEGSILMLHPLLRPILTVFRVRMHGTGLHVVTTSPLHTVSNCQRLQSIATMVTMWVYSPKQAKPAAEEASPAAVGKLFSEQMWTFQHASTFPLAARCRTGTKHASWGKVQMMPLADCANTHQLRNRVSQQRAFLLVHALTSHKAITQWPMKRQKIWFWLLCSDPRPNTL